MASWKRAVAAIFAVCAMALAPVQALAHPHVWVKVKSHFLFDADGKITGVRHAWTFDDMYSAFAIQGLGKDGVPIDQALKALAKVNVTQLAEYGYFTVLRINGKQAAFKPAINHDITMDAKKIITLHFTVMLKTPVKAPRVSVLKVYDPTYFVAFDYAKQAPTGLDNAPKGCSVSVAVPKPLTPQQEARLAAVAGTNDSPGENFGFFLAPSAILACP
ncbi:MAG: DUF1007 family protein [Beijerinckiaceae bacterium]